MITIITKYSESKGYRYIVCDRGDGTYEVRLQQKITDSFMEDDWFGYVDLRDFIHVADSITHAVEIGEEGLRNAAGAE